MHQNVPTLNLPKTAFTRLQNVGKNYCCDLTTSELNCTSEAATKFTALGLLEEELLNGCILSLNAQLDVVLKDEITIGRITELAGPPGTGKTQICFQLCITTQLPKNYGGLEGQVVYLNTNSSFAVHRLKELANKYINQVYKADESIRLQEQNFLKNIYVFNIDTTTDLNAIVVYMGEFLRDKRVKLLIIDSISRPIREISYNQRTQFIYKILNGFQDLSRKFNFAIVITNDFTTKIKDGQAFYAPSFGDGLFDRVNSRICLSKSPAKNAYVAELVKSVVKGPLKVNFAQIK